MQPFTSTSEQDTLRLGYAMGKSLEAGTVIGLNGTLGSGKTRLTQAIGAGLGVAAGDITSPTFTLCVPHEGRLGLLHLDAYRIGNPAAEVDELGLDEFVENGVVVIVEWADRIAEFLPPIDLVISIEPAGAEARLFRFAPATACGAALLATTSKIVGTGG